MLLYSTTYMESITLCYPNAKLETKGKHKYARPEFTYTIGKHTFVKTIDEG